MRVIAGKARSIRLQTPKGMQTRPTTDRIKETLFNILQTGMAGCYFLDLFSGSGAIGIEALSRGAAHCVFVEQDREAVRCIKDNLQKTKLQDESEILEMDVLSAIGRMDKTVRFDYVFMDPPYLNAVEERVLETLADSALITEDTVIIIEAALDTDFSFLEKLPFIVVREKKYKTNRHLFLQMKKPEIKNIKIQEKSTYDNSSISGHF
ncbi:16S rRNA (guanine(966)-N(2))-methyltransferase RsmD [Ruminococcus gauvreauii]|uniref:16S rRNA (Guanine(966)-N(2))-methyltransferase RsmD n=1 Tax=Ruminococcus gauvreauii TaxID=438033 RepID=A0ABY5VHI2_9FIRM|nr:16S rRNA (guanine(966)-N(2))-methyltransferase RsmD [Ruminococcus gauvreauii]UWP59656.1 16S rRNA (guanine(966)-N(2))-methyltransferase RsmD [Ruminococcus gauvreauii]